MNISQNNISSKKIGINNKNQLFLAIAILSTLRLDSITYLFPIFGIIQNLVMLIILAFLLLFYIRKKTISKIIIVISLYSIYIILNGIFHGAGIQSTLIMSQLRIITMSLTLGYGIEKSKIDCLKIFTLVTSFLVYMNFVTVLLAPSGLYITDVYDNGNYLFGYKNIAIYSILPAICISAAYSIALYDKYSLHVIILFLVSLLTQIITDCKTGTVGLIYLGFLLLIIRKKELPKFVNIRNELLLILVMIISIISTGLIDDLNNYMVFLGEEKSLSSRLEVWNRAIELFLKSPIFGYGLHSTEGYRNIIDLDLGFTRFSHPHNFILYLLLQGGLVGAWIMLYLFYTLGKRCSKYKKAYISRVLIVMYMIFFVLGITESMTGAILFLPLLVFSNCIIGIERRSK